MFAPGFKCDAVEGDGGHSLLVWFKIRFKSLFLKHSPADFGFAGSLFVIVQSSILVVFISI